jgi:hypothetical protein
MRHSRHRLTREELAALIASSSNLNHEERASLRQTAAWLLKRLADRIAGQKVN